jgi:hypothetical protein
MKAVELAAAQEDSCCKIAITLIDQRSKRVMAFHEKAGRSQVASWFLLDKFLLLPSRHCRHPSIRTLR